MDVGEAPNQVNMAYDPDVTKRLCEAAINDAGAQARQLAELADEGWIGIEQRVADDWFDYLEIRAELAGIPIDRLDANTVAWFETLQRHKAEAEARSQADLFAAIDGVPSRPTQLGASSPGSLRRSGGRARARARKDHGSRHRGSRDDGSDGEPEPPQRAATVEAVAA